MTKPIFLKILLTFASAEIDAEAIGIDGAEDTGVIHGLTSSADGEFGVTAALFPVGGIFANVGK